MCLLNDGDRRDRQERQEKQDMMREVKSGTDNI